MAGDGRPGVASYGGRGLAGIHAFSRRTYLSLGGFGTGGESVDLYPGFVFTDQDFLRRGYQAYLGLFLEEAIASFGDPDLFGTGWYLNTRLVVPYESRDNDAFTTAADGTFQDLGIETREQALTLSLAVPVSRRFTLGATYALRDLSFAAKAQTDPGFVLPSDTQEHWLDLSLDWRGKRFSTGLGIEAGSRTDWQPWGLGGAETGGDTYSMARWNGGYFRPVGKHQSIAATLSYWKGQDLDRFSRLPGGRTRAGVAGFSTQLGFDEAFFTNLGYSFRAFRRWPVRLRLDAARQWLDEERDAGPRDFVGVNFRFLIHGPWRLDIWPVVSYGVYSSLPGEAGTTVLGLLLSRRQ